MGATDPGLLNIEVAHGGEQEVVVVPLQVPPGTTVEEAVRRSGILEHFPGLEPGPKRVGIFGRHASPDTVLGDGDRVEIYRPIKADPKEVRRRRASRQRRQG